MAVTNIRKKEEGRFKKKERVEPSLYFLLSKDVDGKKENDLRDRTKRFALNIVRMFSSLPKTAEAHVLGKQVLRSGTSIGANYRAAYRSRSRAEFVAKVGDCLKELEETAYWLELLVESHIVDEMHMADLCLL